VIEGKKSVERTQDNERLEGWVVLRFGKSDWNSRKKLRKREGMSWEEKESSLRKRSLRRDTKERVETRTRGKGRKKGGFSGEWLLVVVEGTFVGRKKGIGVL
jgi:hypothetical protein